MESEEVSFQSAFECGLTSLLFWRLQEGHSTIVGPEQRAAVNEGGGGGAPDVQR